MKKMTLKKMTFTFNGVITKEELQKLFTGYDIKYMFYKSKDKDNETVFSIIKKYDKKEILKSLKNDSFGLLKLLLNQNDFNCIEDDNEFNCVNTIGMEIITFLEKLNKKMNIGYNYILIDDNYLYFTRYNTFILSKEQSSVLIPDTFIPIVKYIENILKTPPVKIDEQTIDEVNNIISKLTLATHFV